MASRRKEFFPEVTDEQWNDWHWQVKNRIETLDQLKKYIRLTPDEEEGIRESLKDITDGDHTLLSESDRSR